MPDTLLRRVFRRMRAAVGRPLPDTNRRRIEMTCACRDAEPVPKVAGAGQVFRHRGRLVQRMHQGVLVPAGGYYGEWMTEIIRRLRGHHEPQEELLFHHLLPHCRPGTRIVEVGAFWAYYSSWFVAAVPGGRAVCLEPDATNAACGRDTLELNGHAAVWVEGLAGETHLPGTTFARESDGRSVTLPVHSLASLLAATEPGPVEILHVDAQGAELPFLESLADEAVRGSVRFVVVSTHHESISGSATTHEDCMAAIRRLGGTVLAEHAVEESFSGDGLIVASLFASDAGIELPTISRNAASASLFGRPPPPGGRVRLAESNLGPMIVREADGVIGRSLRDHGRWEEEDVAEVVRFLRRTRRFESRTFVSIGANVGTDLLRALRGGMFAAGVGIEMDAENFRLLEVNTRLNLAAVRPLLLNVALGERVGAASMERSADNFGDHRIRGGSAPAGGRYHEEGRSTLPVAMTTLDAVERDHALAFDATTLLWIDTQGYEGHVLAGAAGIMAREPHRRPAVVCELWPYGLERAGGRERLFAFLRVCRDIRDLGDPHWESASLAFAEVEALYDRLLEDRPGEPPPHTDLLCLH